MTDDKTPEPKKPTEATSAELQELQEIFNTYGRPILIAVLAVLVGLLVVNKIRKGAAAEEQEAAAMMSEARSQADLETIVNEYGKTKVAPQAALSLAKMHYQQGGYAQAIEQYELFMETYPTDAGVKAAELGILLCNEAQAPNAATASELLAFATANADSYLAPQAILGHARCLVAIGQKDEARTVLEDMAKTYADTGWATPAEEELMKLEVIIEREANPLPVPEQPADDGLDEVPEPIVAVPGPATEVKPAAPVPTPAAEPEVEPEAAPEAAPAPEPEVAPEAAVALEAAPAAEPAPAAAPAADVVSEPAEAEATEAAAAPKTN